MNQVRNVLVFPGGTEIGLEIWKALSSCKEVRLFSAGSNVSNHAPYVFLHHSVIPSVHEKDWLPELIRLVKKHRIDYIIPAHDDTVVALARHIGDIPSRIVSSPLDTCLLCRSKSRTYAFFTNDLPVPILFPDPATVPAYPVFVKPDEGQGSQHAQAVYDRRQLGRLLREHDDLIIMEYLPGHEYTVDCFSDREAGLLFCSGRRRVRTRSGISMNSKPVNKSVFTDYARLITEKIPLYGAWFFQLRADASGTLKLMEIAPRIAGTMALHRVLGVNFPLLAIYEQERIPVQIMTNHLDIEIDRALVNRYHHQCRYSAVYVDLDDTLIINDHIDTLLVRFLFQCVNQGLRLVLLTKHAENVDPTLRRHRLTGLFDEIVHLTPTEEKAAHIKEPDAILIDDSFSERKSVHDQLGIMTFDASMIEMLLDERI